MINLPKIILRIVAAAASGVLLSAGFPETDLSFLVWIGFVPLLLAVISLKPVYGYLLSHLTGIVFIAGVFDWILVVSGYTLLHHSLLVFYLGSYFGVLGLLFCFISRRSGPLMALLAVPFIWVALEYMRSNLIFLALPWGLLAHTQYQMPPVIQIASLTGVWGVSFLIVTVNAAIAALCLSFPKFRKDQNLPVPENTRVLPAIAAVLLITTLIYGYWATSEPIEGQSYKLALVQGNIEQDKKWDEKYAKFIMDTYTRLSIEASKSEPDMIVWPEAATPRAIYHDRRMFRDILKLAKSISTPLLFGSTNPQKFKRAGTKNLKFLNSTFLVPPDLKGQIKQRYDKIRLFPFGEYLPYSNVIPWASINVPELTNYQPGEYYKVFEHNSMRFGVTICWENLFPDLVRQFVKNGAEFIINMTNEAWFGKSSAPYQFLSMGVFRAVENRVYVVRCANTGISSFIDPRGHIVNRLKDDAGADTFVRGVLIDTVIPIQNKTVYTLYGDWLVCLCVIGSSIFFIIAVFHKKFV